MNSKEKKNLIAFHIRKIIDILGLDTNDPSIDQTPNRVAKMYVDEVFSGLDPANYPKMSFHQGQSNSKMVLIKNISLISFCEHHLVPMIGIGHISYLPKMGVLGLSSLHRIVRFYAKQPQLQERLTLQISQKLQEELQTEDVAVVIQMKHLCVLARGIEDHMSEVETHILQGCFESNPAIRDTFLLSIKQESKI
ncbi:MAG: GTP cyclohydrolase I FolE [Chlamydiales bacterium]